MARRGVTRRTVALATKRVLDVVVSLCVLIVILPIVAAVALAIVIESPKAPIFVQTRIGRDGRPFALLKFRTMVPEADVLLAGVLGHDPELAAQWGRARKLRDDPRVTRVGRFLRRFSLDEFPQIVNVLRGDMSLVGPRPVILDELALLGDGAVDILSVRPGLTGLWAVSGRSDVDYARRAELERRYVAGWSLRADVAIMVRTIPVIVKGHGAY